MKNIGGKTRLTLGGLIAATHERWGKRRAQGILRLTVNARLVKFKGPLRYEIS